MQISPVQQFGSLNYPAVQEETGQDMKNVYVCNLKLLYCRPRKLRNTCPGDQEFLGLSD